MNKAPIRFTAMLIIVLAYQIIISSVFAQSPEKMSYQSVIRNASGVLVKSLPVGIRISILQTTSTGTAVFVETHSKTTNANGLASLEIGMGTPVTGTFAAIDWAAGPYFIKTETDPLGGTTYTITGTSQLMSVPYAMYAKTAGNSPWAVSGNNIYNSNTGNVGIGAITPTNSLTISRPTGSNSSLSLGDGDVTHGVTTLSGTNDWLLFNEHSNTKGGAQLTGFSDASDNPAFEIKGVNVSDPDLNIPAIVLDAYSANGTGVKALAATKTVLQMQNNGSALVSLLGNGNVGIGTTTPTFKLDVAGAIRSASATGVGYFVASGLGDASNYACLQLQNGESGANDRSWNLVQKANSIINRFAFEYFNGSTWSEPLTILPTGNVGIGTSPSRKLHINGALRVASTTAANLTWGGNGPELTFFGPQEFIGNPVYSLGRIFGKQLQDSWLGASIIIQAANDHDGYVANQLVLRGSGNVGIGTSSPGYTLHVNGSVAGTSAYVNASDIRLKKDMLPITGALNKVLALQGITFNWDKTVNPELKLDDKNHYGFSAQDIEKILPQVVSTADDKMKTKSVAYGDVVPVLVEAIKEQQSQIKGQQQQIEKSKQEYIQLKSDIQILNKKISKIEASLAKGNK